MAEIDYHIKMQSLTGEPDECGDLGIAMTSGDQCVLVLVDALGHGKIAHDIALAARSGVEDSRDKPVTEIITEIHHRLKGTRGAVAAACRLDPETGTLLYSGMGNISIRILGSHPERLVTRDGVLGYMIPTPRQGEARLFPGDILVMTSDGIREHYDPDMYPDLFTGSAEDIAEGLIRHLGRQTDDASCIVLRYGI
ncbi:MAG: serine/threonine-protein phosphatase [Desulfobacterales bacterium]|nr:serine/threonine-protein phosphatase [Desulfobacterales bacterium]